MSALLWKRMFLPLGTSLLVLMAWLLLLNGGPSAVAAGPNTLFVTPNGSGSACTQSHPCALYTALAQAQDGDAIYLAGGTYTGQGAAVITLTKSITLYGGWDGAPTGPVVRDPQVFRTVLDGERVRRVIFITGTIKPTIDGFVITRGNATGLSGGPFNSDSGGGIYSYAAAPVIQNNVITDNIASTQAGVGAMGGGIYIQPVNGVALIRGNRIISNTAGLGATQGDGGGIFLYGTAHIQANHFEENTACRGCTSAGGGGGIFVGWTRGGTEIVDNIFLDNRASGGGGGIYLVWSAVQVMRNLISNNQAGRGGGLYSYYDKGSLVEANKVTSNIGTNRGGGVVINITPGSVRPRLVNNVIARNRAARGGGVYAWSDWHISSITLIHNTLMDNGEGIVAGNHMTITMVNNVVVSHTTGISLDDPSGHVLPDHTLFWANSDDGIRGTHPIEGDPAFVNPAAGDYHIERHSAARDAGVDAGILTDIDGESRPFGPAPDIGADEWRPEHLAYLPYMLGESR